MEAIKDEEGPRATSLPKKKRKHNEEQTKAANLGKCVMILNFAGELLAGVFANLARSQWVQYRCLKIVDIFTVGVALHMIFRRTLRQNPRIFNFLLQLTY
jgi:hypothetical protein